MKLEVELVPRPLWRINLRSKLSRQEWKKLRAEVIAARGLSCAICQSEDQPQAHEVWKYRENRKTGTARVVRIEIVCRACHEIHHWARTAKLAAAGEISVKRLDELTRHFCAVNDCKPKDFKRHTDNAMAVWERRSKLEWTVFWGPYETDEIVELFVMAAQLDVPDVGWLYYKDLDES